MGDYPPLIVPRSRSYWYGDDVGSYGCEMLETLVPAIHKNFRISRNSNQYYVKLGPRGNGAKR